MYKTIFLDMDGVLVDFDSYYTLITGKVFHEVEPRQAAWDSIRVISDTFFQNLPVMPGAYDMVNEIREIAYENNLRVAVLTAVPKIGRIPTARIQKHQWIDEHFPELSCFFNIGPHAQHKQFHCIPGDILIDDSPKNIPQWNDVGGFGILHTSASDSLAKLRKHLENCT